MSAFIQILGFIIFILGIVGVVIGSVAGFAVEGAIQELSANPDFQEFSSVAEGVAGFAGWISLLIQVIGAGNLLAGIAIIAIGRRV
ncbi:MAG: hypothetical protein KKA90_02815 [Nanoarchaeota archaeon]|nr:hypothetical protein [Nanoarchaeota archaeon]